MMKVLEANSKADNLIFCYHPIKQKGIDIQYTFLRQSCTVNNCITREVIIWENGIA